MKIYPLMLALLVFTACSQESPKESLNAEKLIEQKCASCHNLELPPKTFKEELAPPMMAVSFHIINSIEVNNESERVLKSIAFIKDYVLNPDPKKAFCDKKSLQDYGLMPSQKGRVTLDELEAIGSYMFEHYTQANLTEAQKVQNRLNAMPKGELLALQNNCLSCHKIEKDLVGPSFKRVAALYRGDSRSIQEGIRNGSAKKYQSSRGAIMPPFKNLSDSEIESISEWILSLE